MGKKHHNNNVRKTIRVFEYIKKQQKFINKTKEDYDKNKIIKFKTP